MNIKLLIAEDEEIIREGLSELEWGDLGIEMVGTAENGQAAFELAKEKIPDIIISDIRMPIKDGIWLAENIRQHFPNIQIIFLTGYNEVEYLKKAISFQVYEYVLKPIDEDNLFNIVSNLKDAILNKKTAELQIAQFKKTLKESRYFLKSWFINSLSELQQDKLNFFGISKDDKKFSCLVVKFSEDVEYDTFVFFKEIESLLPNPIAFYDTSTLTYIIKHNNEFRVEDIEKQIFLLSEQIKNYLDNNCDRNYTIGIGFIANDLCEIPLGINSALTAISYNFYLGENQIIYIKDVEAKPDSLNGEFWTDYVNAIKVGNSESINGTIKNLFRSVDEENKDLDEQKRVCFELIINTSKAIHEIGQDPKILFHHKDIWSSVNKCKTSQDLYNLCKEMNLAVMKQIQEERKTKNDNVIEKVKDIVDKEYDYGASLESIAAKVYLSPCYLSVIFSQKMNMTFKDYLMKVRIEKAKKLLENTELKVYDIAPKVGYMNSKHFARIFRRFTGMTPSEYRTNLLGIPEIE